jgi:ketosteroid isomerase-like protein
MTSSNLASTHAYLRAVASMGPFENVAQFFTPDVIFQEFPNRISPQGRVSRAADMQAGYEKGRTIMRSQIYDVKRIVESGDEIAVELEWTGVLAVPVLGLPAGTEMRAFVAMFLTFRDGKIVSHRNYDCYAPLESQAKPATS